MILEYILFLFLVIISISLKEIFVSPHKGKARLFLINFLAIEPYLKLHALVYYLIISLTVEELLFAEIFT